jgi:DNA-binding transcriptional ArsR family regulator
VLDAALLAVADPTRRAICQRLAHGRATVGQLAALFPISRPAVSQHLRVLLDAGLIRRTDSGRQSPYELSPVPLLEIEAWARSVAAAWQGAPLPAPATYREERDVRAEPGRSER